MAWKRKFQKSRLQEFATLEIFKDRIIRTFKGFSPELSHPHQPHPSFLYGLVQQELGEMERLGFHEIPWDKDTIDLFTVSQGFQSNHILTILKNGEQFKPQSWFVNQYGSPPKIEILENNEILFEYDGMSTTIREQDISLRLDQEDLLFPEINLSFSLYNDKWTFQLFFLSYTDLTHMEQLLLERLGIEVPEMNEFCFVDSEDLFYEPNVTEIVYSDDVIDLSTNEKMDHLNSISFDLPNAKKTYKLIFPIHASALEFIRKTPSSGLTLKHVIDDLKFVFRTYIQKEKHGSSYKNVNLVLMNENYGGFCIESYPSKNKSAA